MQYVIIILLILFNANTLPILSLILGNVFKNYHIKILRLEDDEIYKCLQKDYISPLHIDLCSFRLNTIPIYLQ